MRHIFRIGLVHWALAAVILMYTVMGASAFFWSSQAERVLESMFSAAGTIKQVPLTPSTEPLVTCAAGTKGLILYDNTVSLTCVCNGTKWVGTNVVAPAGGTATTCGVA
jgi:hypothetical protein